MLDKCALNRIDSQFHQLNPSPGGHPLSGDGHPSQNAADPLSPIRNGFNIFCALDAVAEGGGRTISQITEDRVTLRAGDEEWVLELSE